MNRKVSSMLKQKPTRGTALTIFALALVLFLNACRIDEPTWPQWRGPQGDGVSTETGLPIEWSEDKNILWKVSIEGLGHSSPIVWGDRIFLTTAIEGEVVPGAKAPIHYESGQEFFHPDSVGADRKHTFKVLGLDTETGKLLWEQTAYEGTVYDNRHRRGSYASMTPTTDGRYVYAYLGSQGVYAYDFDGNKIWKADLGGIASFGVGLGSSPVLYQNLLILQCDEDTGEKSFIVALDKNTGEEVWKEKRAVQASWATPKLVETSERTELLTSGNEFIISYDPESGKELWRSEGVKSNAIATPLAGHDLVFVSAGFPTKITQAIRPGGSGDLTGSSSIVWEHKKGTAYVPSNLLYGNYLYLVSDKGILTCLDAKTGELVYEGGRVPLPTSFMASPVAFEDKILLVSVDGHGFVIKAGPKHEVLSVNTLEEPVWASPAIAGGRIYIRGDKSLYAIGSK
jgi:outer membrane protein assembly factor BamB